MQGLITKSSITFSLGTSTAKGVSWEKLASLFRKFQQALRRRSRRQRAKDLLSGLCAILEADPSALPLTLRTSSGVLSIYRSCTQNGESIELFLYTGRRWSFSEKNRMLMSVTINRGDISILRSKLLMMLEAVVSEEPIVFGGLPTSR